MSLTKTGTDRNPRLRLPEKTPGKTRSRNEICYRCKWLCDGSDSIDDMILCYENAIRHLRRLKDDGYELRESMGCVPFLFALFLFLSRWLF